MSARHALSAVLLLVSGLLSTAVPEVADSVAQENGVQGADEAPVIAALRANGAKVLALGERGGLSGHFVELAEGDAYGLYVTPDGHAVAGLLYAPDGTLLTGRQIAAAGGRRERNEGLPADDPALLAHAYDEGPVVTGVEVLFERSGAAFGFTLGQSGPLVAVFADPGCRWSRSAVARLGGPALEGRLRLRVVPVAVLGAASAREAASIATVSDPALAWFEGTYIQGGPEGARRIKRNNALFDAWGVGAVPLIAWRASDGSIAHRVGDVDDIDAWLEALPHE